MNPPSTKEPTRPRSHRPPADATLNRYAHQWGATNIPFSEGLPGAHQQDHPQLQQAFQYLNQSAALRSLMLLSGPNGVGKSHLLSHWRDQLDPRQYQPIAITQASLSHAGLLAYLARKLGKPSGTRSTTLMHLEDAFIELGETTAVIILDEAQNYSHSALEEIRLLLGINLTRRPAFSLILIGDDYLLGALKLRSHRALYTRIACHHRLEAWSPEEIQSLLEASQSAVGLQGELILPAAIELIVSASAGMPRTALHLARAAWIAASHAKDNHISAEHLQSIIPSIPAVSDSVTPSLT
jgi:general secretion pathway protein A